MNKILLISIVTICIVCTLAMVYFASQVSAVYDPLKKYSYSISSKSLKNELFNLAKENSHIICKIGDTTGSKKSDFSYYMDIKEVESNSVIHYTIRYEDDNSFWKTNNSQLRLIGVFDSINKIGGFKVSDNGVPFLIKKFEQNILGKIPSQSTSH